MARPRRKPLPRPEITPDTIRALDGALVYLLERQVFSGTGHFAARVQSLASLQLTAEEWLTQQVWAAKEAGWSWADLADLTGLTVSGAMKHYGPIVKKARQECGFAFSPEFDHAFQRAQEEEEEAASPAATEDDAGETADRAHNEHAVSASEDTSGDDQRRVQNLLEEALLVFLLSSPSAGAELRDRLNLPAEDIGPMLEWLRERQYERLREIPFFPKNASEREVGEFLERQAAVILAQDA